MGTANNLPIKIAYIDGMTMNVKDDQKTRLTMRQKGHDDVKTYYHPSLDSKLQTEIVAVVVLVIVRKSIFSASNYSKISCSLPCITILFMSL